MWERSLEERGNYSVGISREAFWHVFAKIPRHTRQNAITEGDLECILTRNCEGTEQLRNQKSGGNGMSQEMEFKNIVAQYSKVKPEEMTGEMRFREDLGFTSLDFMSFLGELEDTFDIELDENEVTKITTLEEALKLLEELQ